MNEPLKEKASQFKSDRNEICTNKPITIKMKYKQSLLEKMHKIY